MAAEVLQITDDDLLRRWVPRDQVDNDGKIMSIFFRTTDQSADLAKLRSRKETQTDGKAGSGLVEFTAGHARHVGLNPVHDPCPPEAPTNHAHVLCKGKLSSGKAQRLRSLADYCVKCGESA